MGLRRGWQERQCRPVVRVFRQWRLQPSHLGLIQAGVMVEQFASGRTLLEGYGIFFLVAGSLGIPALVLCLFLARVKQTTPAANATGR